MRLTPTRSQGAHVRPREPRTPRTRKPVPSGALVAGVVAVALAAQFADAARAPSRHNASSAPGLSIAPMEGWLGFRAEPGTVAINSLLRVDSVARVTVLDIEPYSRSPGVELLAVRAVFHGHGTSPGGYRMFGGYPLGTCTTTWPGSGFGPSYPVAGLRLAPGDPVQFVFYLRPPGLGIHRVTGYRLTYRTQDGLVYVVTGDRGQVEMDLRSAADLADEGGGHCDRDPGDGWIAAAPGWPR